MTPFPINAVELFGQYGAYLLYLAIGFAFGFVLEIAGFGNSPKLAAQFYLKEMTVLKVMFTAIVIAMLGVFFTSAVGLLDYNLVWVNPTYLWPGIVGGLIMGVGFILGGFCPGTSLVSMATGKIDGLFFVLGVFFGIFAFGESVQSFNDFFYASYMGRFTLMDWLGIPTGWVVLIVSFMALFMFWGAEQLEKIFGGIEPKKAPQLRHVGAGMVVILAAVILLIGQPTNSEKWQMLEADKGPELVQKRAYQIHPGELLDLMHNDKIKLHLIDVRSEADYNLFHVKGAEHIPLENLEGQAEDLLLEPSNAVFVLMSNNEDLATEGWKILEAEQLHNIYLLEGGMNYWLDIFANKTSDPSGFTLRTGDEDLQYTFDAALGDRHPAATPDPEEFELEYIPKVKLELKKGPTGGGCG